jgi:proteasome accessory factor A
VQAFLVTRQIFAGSGKFAIEAEDKFLSPGFQISQRSDFFCELQSVDTMQRRPIINTRDEPHANPKRFRRFHVIVGDANMSPFATRLKVGATALVLEALVLDPKRKYSQLADPLAALQAVSRDLRFRWDLRLEGGRPSTALALQREYLAAVREVCDVTSPVKAALVADWEAVLNDLETDCMRCRNRLDWVAKLGLVRDFQKAQNLSDDDPWLQSLDLEYHRLDLAEGLYYGLEQSGAMLGVPEEGAVRRAVTLPPTTRATVRGKCIQKFASSVIAAQWDHITLQGTGGPIKISLVDLFAPEDVLRCGRAIDAARSPDDLRILG